MKLYGLAVRHVTCVSKNVRHILSNCSCHLPLSSARGALTIIYCSPDATKPVLAYTSTCNLMMVLSLLCTIGGDRILAISIAALTSLKLGTFIAFNFVQKP